MRLLLTLAVVAAGCPSAASAAAQRHHRPRCPGATRPATAHNLKAMRAAILCLVNQQRRKRGLPALVEDRRLDHSAQRWTAHMVAHDEFSHGSNFASRLTAAGFDWSAAGENIATGYPTPAAVVGGWMASPGHCRNILAPDFSAIGIGVVAAPVAGYASGPATWTQDFGLPNGRPAPSSNERPADGCPY